MSPLTSEPTVLLSGDRRPAARRHVGVWAAALLLAASLAGTAEATEGGRAERLYTKGLAELHAGHRDAAVALFQQAVDADPDDIHGLYYRALGYGHLGRFEDAVTDLKKVVAADNPSIDRDRLELGYALFRLERYDEAATELEISILNDESTADATMLLGMVETRRGNQEAAQSALAKVESLEPARALPVRYYMGLAAYRAGDNATAAEQFSWVADQPGNNPYARESKAFLERIREQGGRPYRLHAGTAFEYDSNVALAPDNANLANNVYGISNKSDGRAVITAGGKYQHQFTPEIGASAGYDFLQSLHFDLQEYDVQTHQFGAEAHYIRDAITVGLATGYEHSLLDGDSLLNGATVLPWLRYDEGDFGRSEVYYRMRYRNFLPSAFSPVRDNVNNAAGVRQFFSLGAHDRNFILGYRFDSDQASEVVGRLYNYNGNQFEFGLDWAFTDTLRADALYAYRIENYDAASGDRDDHEHQILSRLQKRVAPYTWVSASYIYRDNQSDQLSYDYTRHIVSVGIELRY